MLGIIGHSSGAPAAAPSGSLPDPADPIAAAQARAAATNALGFPTPTGLPPAALAQAQRLPAWMWGIGSGLQDAFYCSGQAAPVNFSQEAQQSVHDLMRRGYLPEDTGRAILTHPGTLAPQIFELVRNETLVGHGVTRTYDPAALGVTAS